MNIDTLTAVLKADASGFTPVMEKASGQLRQLPVHADHANAGMRRLRSGLEMLAIQATGVSSSVGRVTSALLLLGAGSTLVLGVTAGIGLIVGAYKLATQTAKELRQENDRLTASFESAMAAGRANVAAMLQLRKGMEDLEKAQAKLEALQRTRQWGFRFGFGPVLPASQADIVAAEHNVAVAQNAVAALTQNWDDAKTKIVDAARTDTAALQSVADGFALIQDSVNKLVNDPAFQSFLSSISLGVPAPGGTIVGVKPGTGFNLGAFLAEGEQAQAAQSEAAKLANRLGMSIGGLGRASEQVAGEVVDPMKDLLKQGGYDAGRALIQGFIEGTLSLTDLLRNFIISFITSSILKVLSTALGIASPSRVAIAMGQNFATGLAMGVSGGGPSVSAAVQGVALRMAGGATFRLDMSGMPPATNPLAAARDKDFQRFFREGALVAKADGFKFT